MSIEPRKFFNVGEIKGSKSLKSKRGDRQHETTTTQRGSLRHRTQKEVYVKNTGDLSVQQRLLKQIRGWCLRICEGLQEVRGFVVLRARESLVQGEGIQ